MELKKILRRNSIRKRVRKIVTGTAERPRLSVFRSNKQIYAQLIDDINGTTLVAASSREEIPGDGGNTKIEKAAVIGKILGERAVAAGVTDVVFDRGGYLYHGRVKSLAEGARNAGLKF